MTALAPIVVGIDGGGASVAALELAIREARLRGTHVRALTCWPSTDRRDDSGPLLCSSHDQATEVLDHVVSGVKQRGHHDVLITHEVRQGRAGHELVAASRDADLIILGSATRGPYGRHHGRETIEDCLLYAQCPVVIVPWSVAALDQRARDIDLHQRSRSA